MAITREQAQAFYAALLDADTLERCEEMLGYVADCTDLLASQIANRPRQHEFDLEGGAEAEEEDKPKKSRRKKA